MMEPHEESPLGRMVRKASLRRDLSWDLKAKQGPFLAEKCLGTAGGPLWLEGRRKQEG